MSRVQEFPAYIRNVFWRPKFSRGATILRVLPCLSCMGFASKERFSRAMAQLVDQETFERLLPLACQWARTQEELILTQGHPLSAGQTADAFEAGVKNCERIRLLIVDRIPIPDDPELAEISIRTQILTPASRAWGIGYGIMVRADSWGDRELLFHNLVHVAQCERVGGVERWVGQYLAERLTCGVFTLGRFEHEARTLAGQICAANAVTA